MARHTGGAFDGVGSHGHDIDHKEGSRIAAEFKAEQRRIHLAKIAKRKANRQAAAAQAKILPK